jgi:hypothetical protein
MSLRHLAGTFPLVFNSDSVPANGAGPTLVTYMPGVGIVAATGSGVAGLSDGMVSLISPDGVIAPIAWRYNEGFAIDTIAGFLRPVFALPGSKDMCYEPLAFCQSVLACRFAALYLPMQNVQGVYVDVVDRRLLINGTGVDYGIYGQSADSTIAEEVALALPGWPVGMMTLCVGRSLTEVMVGMPLANGTLVKIQFYDTLARKYNSQALFVVGTQILCAVFAQDLGILFTFNGPLNSGDTTPYSMDVWSLDVVPAAMSAPTLVYGSSGQGKVATYQVTVTGDQGESCEGVSVEWSNSGQGTLLEAESVTNADGQAETQVLFAQGVTGAADLTATVVD